METKETIQVPMSFERISSYFCGCGDTRAAWQFVLDYLTDCERKPDGKTRWEMGCDNWDGKDYLVRYVLDHLDLTEHGTSIHWCWLTKDGEEVLAFLREFGVDWDSKGIDFVDSRGSHLSLVQ